MTIGEAAKLWGLNRSSVRRLVRQGIVPAQKELKTKAPGYQYIIPDNTESPRKFAKRAKPGPKPLQKSADQLLSPAGYVAKYGGTKSIEQIADALGITRNEVRRLYDMAL